MEVLHTRMYIFRMLVFRIYLLQLAVEVFHQTTFAVDNIVVFIAFGLHTQ